jgi:hypothetical protein
MRSPDFYLMDFFCGYIMDNTYNEEMKCPKLATKNTRAITTVWFSTSAKVWNKLEYHFEVFRSNNDAYTEVC